MNLHGFELVQEQPIPELNTQARLFRHIRTGAQLLSMENKDENKVFGVNFYTPPSDSTGLPHILEHSVLGGSRKYPVREPFMELLKGSLNTFLNAMTFADMTLYPVASQNLKDFYNLVDVYLDAVFYPRISEKTLQQEGWHYELESKDAPLTYKGVVFNEMKGVYSSPDQVLGRTTQMALFPDTLYGLDSGGDPAVIPDLTYETFKKFHQTYYHPSNARIYFYGDDDPEERLRLIDAFITDFQAIQIEAVTPLQPRFNQPRSTVQPYEAGEGDKKGMMTVSWLLTEANDTESSLALQILAHILTGTPASPLRKALMESELGEDLTGGLDPYQRELYFSTGLKGIAVEDAGKVETLILDTLAHLADNGIEPEMIEAALNTTEFQLRELNTGRMPRGLALMMGMMPVWMSGGDPIEALGFEAPLQHIKSLAANGGGYFEGLIGKYFLQNKHRSTVLLQPDPTVREKRDAAEQERLNRARTSFTDADIERVIADTHELRRIQETPDTPEDLAKIPSLKLADLDKEQKPLPREELTVNGGKVLFHDLPTNGVVYLDVGFNLHALPQEYLPYVNLFGRALVEIGTQTEDYVKLSQRIGRKTGGLYATSFTSSVYGGGESAAWLMLRGKGMAAQAQDLLDILHDVLLTVKLDNPARFRQMVSEEKAGKESAVNSRGHSFANWRIRAHLNEADWAAEQMNGVSYLFFLRELADKVDKDWPSVLAILEKIRAALLNRRTMVFNVTLDSDNWSRFQPQLGSLIGTLPDAAVATPKWSITTPPAYEGLAVPSQVNYVGKGANLYQAGYKLHGSYRVILQYLDTTYIHNRIRAQGGAYGGFTVFDQPSGSFTYLSYRDPNLLGTLDNYDGTPQFLRELDLHEDELTKSIIGAIGDMDAHLLPDAKGYTSLLHNLIGYTQEMRQRQRDEVLGTTAADFKAFADTLETVNQKGLVAVVGSQEAITAANAERENFLHITKVL
jgi:Zn-dependent M16 (insulinase) family peptidase